MKRFASLSLIALLTLVGATSCSNGVFEYVEEDLETVNVREDKYRNFYEIFVASYYDSDGDGMGDLRGVAQKLDYIKSLGFNGIWLMPIFQSPSYHKYNATDYFTIDPDFGTQEDLDYLIKECHERDIRLILDLVLNHCSQSNPWFSKSAKAYAKKITGHALTAEEEKWHDVFAFKTKIDGVCDAIQDDEYNVRFYVQANFAGCDMPELNYDSDYCVELMKGVTKYYLDKGIDGFRLDAVKYVYETEEQTIDFLGQFQDYCETINPNAFNVGECWDSASTIARYYESGLDSFFYFPAAKATGFICSSLDLDGQLCNSYLKNAIKLIEHAKGHIPAPFLDNHDMSRMSGAGLPRTKFMYGLLSMLNGSTFTYYGDEVGMTGIIKPDENARTYMNWSQTDLTGRCKNPELAGPVNYINDPVDVQLTDSNSILNYYKKANFLRNQIPAIARGSINKEESIADKENRFVRIVKDFEGEKYQFLFNFNKDKDYVFSYKDLDQKELVGQLVSVENETIKVNEEQQKLLIPSFGIAILK